MNLSKKNQEKEILLRYGLRLEYMTLAWNVIGIAILVYAIYNAKSVALVGFGLDSLIEIGASMVVIWELTGTNKNREKTALRLIAGAFFSLALYILFQSVRTLFLHICPDTSSVGMLWLVLTFIVMVLLARAKRKAGEQLSNPVLLTEGQVTLVDAYLAFCVLVGLALNALWSWWWADPLAGLVIVFYGFRESYHAWNTANSSNS